MEKDFPIMIPRPQSINANPITISNYWTNVTYKTQKCLSSTRKYFEGRREDDNQHNNNEQKISKNKINNC